MAGTESLNSSSYNNAGTDFDNESSRMSEAIGELTARLDALSGCWGNDGPGQAFGNQYQAHAAKMTQAARSLATGLGVIADRLHQQATVISQLNTSG